MGLSLKEKQDKAFDAFIIACKEVEKAFAEVTIAVSKFKKVKRSKKL